MRAGARLGEGATVEDVTDRLLVVTVNERTAALRLSEALWDLDRRGELAVFAAIVLAAADGTYDEVAVNCPDSVPSALDALRKLLDAAERDEKTIAGDADYAGLVRSISGLRNVAGAALLAEVQEEDPEHLDQAVRAVEGRIFRAGRHVVNSPLQSEQRIWTLRKKASRSEGDARRRHLERADRMTRVVRQ